MEFVGLVAIVGAAQALEALAMGRFTPWGFGYIGGLWTGIRIPYTFDDQTQSCDPTSPNYDTH